jgi:hypothetical protein
VCCRCRGGEKDTSERPDAVHATDRDVLKLRSSVGVEELEGYAAREELGGGTVGEDWGASVRSLGLTVRRRSSGAASAWRSSSASASEIEWVLQLWVSLLENGLNGCFRFLLYFYPNDPLGLIVGDSLIWESSITL